MSDSIESRLKEAYADMTTTPELREDVLKSLKSLPRETPPAAPRRPIRMLVGAAVAATVLVAAILLGRSPATDEAAPLAATAQEALGPELHRELIATKGGLERIRLLIEHRDRLATLSPEAGLEIADRVFDAFPWSRHEIGSGLPESRRQKQKDLFAIRDLVVKNDFRELSWLFVRMLEHGDPYVRLHGVQRMQDLRTSRHATEVATALGDVDDRVRAEAARALVAWNVEASRPAVLALLRDPDEDVREAVAHALETWRDPETRRAVIAILGDPDFDVRSAAATTLERQDAKDALPALRAAREKEVQPGMQPVLDSVIRSLEALRGERRPVKALGSWTGPTSGVEKADVAFLGDEKGWARNWERVRGREPRPNVSFGRQFVLGVFAGEGFNSRGYDAVVTEDDGRMLIRLRQRFYQTMGGRGRGHGVAVPGPAADRQAHRGRGERPGDDRRRPDLGRAGHLPLVEAPHRESLYFASKESASRAPAASVAWSPRLSDPVSTPKSSFTSGKSPKLAQRLPSGADEKRLVRREEPDLACEPDLVLPGGERRERELRLEQQREGGALLDVEDVLAAALHRLGHRGQGVRIRDLARGQPRDIAVRHSGAAGGDEQNGGQEQGDPHGHLLGGTGPAKPSKRRPDYGTPASFPARDP
jgi:hypothetical protein